MNSTILLTFDVEDWFQVENFKKCIPFSAWPSCELRVEKNVHKILNLLDSITVPRTVDSAESTKPFAVSHELSAANSVPSAASYRQFREGEESTPDTSRLAPNGSIKATFFILGWIAKRLPNLIREIQARGHEVASHGYDHILCKEQPVEDLKNDLMKSKKLLEDITRTPIYGYRAPSFSINNDILKIIEDSGYLYDSSFNSFKLNRRYGQLQLGTNDGSNGISIQISNRFYELPITNLEIGKRALPWGGGGYFRLIPSYLFNCGIQSILSRHGAYMFYMHPWEIDPDQPKVSEIPGSIKFRHYMNLDKTYTKLSILLEALRKYHFSTCIQYITEETLQAQ